MALSETNTEATSSKEQTIRFDLGLTVAYAILIGYLTFRHEFWSDEAQQWLIVKASHGIADLHQRLAYEGHPLPWYLILYPFAHLSNNIEWIKLINPPLAVATCYLTCRYFLRNPYEKTLFLLAPMPVFYFSVLARPYMLGCLLIVLICLALRRPERSTRLFCLIAALGSLHIYFAIVGGVFLLYYAMRLDLRRFRRFPGRIWIGIAATTIVLATTCLQCLPPSDTGYQSIYMASSLSRAIDVFGLAMAPFMLVQTNAVAFSIVTFFYCAIVWFVAQLDWKIGVFAIAATLPLCLFEGFAYGGSEWHVGVVYTCLLAAIFLIRNSHWPEKTESNLNMAFAGILALNAIGGALILYDILQKPYSNSKYVAAYIQDICKNSCSILSENTQLGIPVSAYLGGAPLFYANKGVIGTYTLMDNHEISPDLQAVVIRAHSMPSPILLLGKAASPGEIRTENLIFLKSFTDAVVINGSYYVYGVAGELPAGMK